MSPLLWYVGPPLCAAAQRQILCGPEAGLPVRALVWNWGGRLVARRSAVSQNRVGVPICARPTIGAVLMGLVLVLFLINLIATLGWANVLSLAVPQRRPGPQPEATT